MTPSQFVSELGGLKFPNAFNPYSDECHVHDLPNAAVHRSRMLIDTLEAACKVPVESIWVGRDLGYRGGRRTGLAFTDDVQLQSHQEMWGINGSRPTSGKAVSERSATVVWKMLREIELPILLWNAFPLHPHREGEPFTNRSHTADERRAGTNLLRMLIEMVRPKRLIAIGNDAEKSVAGLLNEIEIWKVRHPSYGGQTQFAAEIRKLYGSRELKLL